jgi:hypothetical protein
VIDKLQQGSLANGFADQFHAGHSYAISMRQAGRSAPCVGVDDAAGYLGLAEADPTLGALLE